MQIANEHLGSMGLNVQFNITGIIGVLEEIKNLAENGASVSSELIDKYIMLLMEPIQVSHMI